MGESPRFGRLDHYWKFSAFCLPIIAIAASLMGAAPFDGPTEPVRVRFEWGGAKPEVWSGVLELSEGAISEVASLGTDADEAGSLWADGNNLWLQRRGLRIYDGFDATLLAAPSARLCLTLQTAGPAPLRQRFECTLSKLLAKPTAFTVKDPQLNVSISRAPGDGLRVVVERPHLIYHPGEQFKAALIADPAIWGKPIGPTKLEWTLCEPHDGKRLSQGSLRASHLAERKSPNPLAVEIPLPKNEGPCDIHFRLVGNAGELAASSVQVLVLADVSPVPADGKAEAILVDQFHPGDRNEHHRIVPRPESPLSRPGISPVFGKALLGAAELSSGGVGAVDWTAYRLQLKHPQRPHRLVVHIRAQGRPFVGVSLLEPNAANQLMPLTLDSGLVFGRLVTPEEPNSSQSSIAVHQVLFWPRVCEPILLLHDMGAGRRFDCTAVEVYELSALPAAGPIARGADERLVGPYLSKPVFPENFGAPQAFDAATGRSLDDWGTFHTAALRAADYLQWAGYNSLMMAVLADGSTIYPSRLLEPTLRYDSGRFFSTGQDPMRKDVLELLYRVFDRERLVLIPELQFSTPLPALERQLAGNATAAAGIEMIGRDGRTWHEARGCVRGVAPYYNPLDPRVQEAILQIVRELVDRYRRHPSFHGIALEVSAAGYLQFPSLEWGYDDATIARFQRDTGVTLADSSRPEAKYDFLTGEARAQWIRWRCRELAKFHRQLAEVVTKSHPTARLVLACKRVLAESETDDEVRREIRTRGRLGDLLPERGLDFSLLAGVPRLSVLRPAVWRTSTDAEDSLLDEAANDNASFDAAFSGAEGGLLTYRPPRECRIADFDGVSPWRPAFTWVAVHSSPAGRENRRRLARALAAGDAQMLFDGGWMIPLGQEDETRELRQIFRALPRVPFYKFETDDRPASIRVARRDKKTYLYAANEFDVPMRISIRLSCPAGTTCRSLGVSRPSAIEADGDSAGRLGVSLDHFGVAAWEIDHEDVRVLGLEAQLPPEVLASLESRIHAFEERLAEARRSVQSDQSPDGGPHVDQADATKHESTGHELPIWGAAYWTVHGAGSDSHPEHGPLRLAAADKERSLQSSSSAGLAGKRLFVKLCLRGDRDKTPARLSFETKVDGVSVERHVDVTADADWRPFEFRIDDLPDGSRPNARLRVENLGAGRIWADDVVVQSEHFSSDDLRQLAKLSLAIALAWDEKRFAECERLLDGYWGRFLMFQPQRPPSRLSLREPKLLSR